MKQTKYLPDWFEFTDYEKLFNETDLSYWALLFADRAKFENNQEFLAQTGGYVTDKDSIKLTWKNGVKHFLSPNHVKQYMDGYETHFLKKFNGKLIPDNDYKPDENILNNILKSQSYEDGFQLYRPHGKINSTIDSPLKAQYQTTFNQPARHEFPDKQCLNEYKNITSYIDRNTTAFMVNLKMPTSRLIEELKTQIAKLKDERNISEYQGMKNPRSYEWAQSLAVWDLWKDGVKPRVIQNRVLAIWHDNFQKPQLLTLYDKALENMFESRKNTAKVMINSDWKKLSGAIDLNP